MQYTVGSLFAGVGGICLGFKYAMYNDSNYEVLWANEIDEYACTTYRLNFDDVDVLEGDIEKIMFPHTEPDQNLHSQLLDLRERMLERPIDILTAGFPCQAFSIAGNQKGFCDSRGNVFWSIIDTIEALQQAHSKKPQVVFLENVKNLKSHDQGRTYKIIRDELYRQGYTVMEKVINTKDITKLPQNRERIYIVGFLDEKVASNFSFPKADAKVWSEEERKKNIAAVLDLDLTMEDASRYYYTKEKYPRYFGDPIRNADLARRTVGLNIEEEITEEFEFYQIRRGMYVRKNKSGVCPTLTANMGTGGHNVPLIKVKDGIRKLTPAETFKLQGFPIGNGYELPKEYKGRPFADGRLYKQAGNAVSVEVITLIATRILEALEKSKKTQRHELIAQSV